MNYISYGEHSIKLFNMNKPGRALQFTYSPFEKQLSNESMRSPDYMFSALLGFKMINDKIPFLIFAREDEPCCNLRGAVIYEMKNINWLPVVQADRHEDVLEQHQEKIKQISKLFQDHHYFSDSYKPYKPYHLNFGNLEKSIEQQVYYKQFVFNQSLMRINDKQQINEWCKPLIQGYVQSFSTFICNQIPLTFTLISRRSNRKAGTRYYARGVDDKGNVANFTETEQIITYGKHTISHLQVRGSVPAFFEQLGISGLNGELNIVRNQITTQKPFETHFQHLHEVYDRIFCINLLSIKKKDEEKLTLFYENLVNDYAPLYVRYQYYDFHEECKDNKFENSDNLINKLQEVLNCFGFTVINNESGQVIQRQTGVVRTNCMDCLDRTNYMQSRVALHALKSVLNSYSPSEVRSNYQYGNLFTNKLKNSSELLKNFNDAWANNGDSISFHYTGIGSTHTDITKTGQRTVKGSINHKMRSLMRFFVQFTDTKKNEAITELVEDPFKSRVSYQQSNTLYEFVNVVVMSFKIIKDNELKQKHGFLFTEEYIERKRPAIVVICGFNSAQQKQGWLEWLKNKFPIMTKTYSVRRLGYEIINRQQNQHNCLLIFGNEAVIPYISQLKNQMIGNFKDSMLICKFKVFQTSMVFTASNCQKFADFQELLDKSHEEAFQMNRLGQARSSSILNHNFRTVLGNIASHSYLSDRNFAEFKSQLEYLQTKGDQRGATRLINELIDNDVFVHSCDHLQSKYLKYYMEGPLTFAPERNRIIFWNQENLIFKVLEYSYHTGQQCTFGHFNYELKKTGK